MAPAGLPVRGAAEAGRWRAHHQGGARPRYDSVPAFITMFKRMLGASPRGYMRGARDSGEGARRQPGPARLESPDLRLMPGFAFSPRPAPAGG